MKRRRSTPDHERILRDERADPFDRSDAVHLLALDRLVQFEPEIAAFLDHPSEDLRDEAIRALVYYFELGAYVPRAMNMLTSDASESVRATAASSIGMYAFSTGRQRDEIIRALVRAIEHDQDPLVVGFAYDRLRDLVPSACKSSRRDTVPPEEVRAMINWDELVSYRGH